MNVTTQHMMRKKGSLTPGIIIVWLIVAVIFILVLFNQYSERREDLGDVFPDEESVPEVLEYEIVTQESVLPQEAANVPAEESSLPKEKETFSEDSVSIQKETPEVEENYFTVQAASFRTMDRAERAVKELKEKGFDPFIVSKKVDGQVRWHRVCVGKFPDKEKGAEVLKNIQKYYPDSFFIKRQG